jgi:hypothetical protein
MSQTNFGQNLIVIQLSGLGLGGLVHNILGGLGLTSILESLGVGSVVGALTGKKDKDKKK